jgi:hypothetical protein
MSYVAVAGIAISIGTSMIGASNSRKQADKQREFALNMHNAELAQQEKLAYAQMQTQSETERIKILSDSIEKYREALQKEGTIRLRDTWIYVAGLGCGTGVIYAISLMYSKSGSNAK